MSEHAVTRRGAVMGWPRRMRGRFLREREASTDVGPSAVVGHVLAARDGGLWAYYELRPQRWSFLDLPRRERLVVSGASRWAALAPRAVKLRSSSRPYPAVEWAADLDAAHAAARLPDVYGAVEYDELLRHWKHGRRQVPLSYDGWLRGTIAGPHHALGRAAVTAASVQNS